MRHVITASNMPSAKVAALARGKSVRLKPANFTEEGYSSVTIDVTDLKAFKFILDKIERELQSRIDFPTANWCGIQI